METKHYTYEKAVEEVGESTNYKIAKKVSAKKWKEIVRYRERYYSSIDGCGFCIVHRNRTKTGCHFSSEICPAKKICGLAVTPEEMVKLIEKIKV